MASYTESAMRKRIDVVSDSEYQFSRSLRGVPSPGNRTYRASVNCWERGLSMTRTVGTGVGVFGESVYLDDAGDLANAGTGTVKVIHDGITRYMPINHYRRERPSTRKTATVESKAERQARRDFELQAAMGSNHEGDV